MGGARPPLILDQTEVRRAEKNFFQDRPPPPSPLSEGLDPPLRELYSQCQRFKN